MRLASSEDRIGRTVTTAATGLLIAVVTWPAYAESAIGVDASWHAALHMAAAAKLSFGSEVVFTFGPLGFLEFPDRYYGPSSLAATVVDATVRIGAAVLLVHVARRYLPLAIAAVVAVVAARALRWLGLADIMVLLVFALAVEHVRATAQGQRPPPWGPAVLGAVAGASLLGKINAGILIVVLGLIASTAAFRPPIRGASTFGLSAAVSTVGLWLVSGGRLGDLSRYSTVAVDIVIGYAAAMGTAGVGGSVLAAAAACFAAAVLPAGLEARGWRVRNQVGLGLLVAVMVVGVWKAGFTRGHVDQVFASAAFAAVPLVLSKRQAVLGVARFVAIIAMIAVVTGRNPVAYLDPVGSIREFKDDVALVLDAERRGAALAATRAEMVAAYGLDDAAAAAISGRRVHIDPLETGVAWAYADVAWSPLPTIQSYVAYTTSLDRLNAERLSAPGGPELILREPFYALDGRHPWFEAPLTTLELVCRFREVGVPGRWQFLERGDNRCGPATSLGRTRVEPGQEISVPAAPADHILVARINGPEPSIIERLGSLALASPVWSIILDEGRAYRIVPDHLAGPLIVAAPQRLGYDPRYAPPVVGSLLVLRDGDPARTPVLTVEFQAIPLN